jgi:hypothetical protein
MGSVGIIEFELAATADKASDFYGELGATGRDAAKDSLYIDFLYLVLYAATYAMGCLIVAARAAERGMDRLARWGRPLAIGSVLAACCDTIENLALLRVLEGHTDQPWPGIAAAFASVKFLLLTVAGLYVIVGFLLTLFKKRRAAPAEPATPTA